jgi:hypothetical protein
MMTNPWSSLDAATGEKKLFLDERASSQVVAAFRPYQGSLQQLITDALDDTTGYFGTSKGGKNPLAKLLEDAFNARGKMLTDYVKAQLSQAQDFVKTAQDAHAALKAADAEK